MGKLVQDLTNKTFGRLTVIKRSENKGIFPVWICKCSCNGNEREYYGHCLRDGSSKSCGCLQKETISKRLKKYNTYDLSDEFGIGYTTNGEPFYFDLEDYNKIKDYCWIKGERDYIITTLKNHKHLSQHRLIMDAKDSEVVDHIYHINFDNRKSQLRKCTLSENMFNRVTNKNNTSGRKGVYWVKRDNIWLAKIMVNNKNIHLGNFYDFDDAVKAREEAEQIYFGEFNYKEKLPQFDLDTEVIINGH